MKKNSIISIIIVLVLCLLSMFVGTLLSEEPDIVYYEEQVYVRDFDDANAQYYAFKSVVDYKNSTKQDITLRFKFIISMENPELLEMLVIRNKYYKSEMSMTYYNWDTGKFDPGSYEYNCWVLIMER